MIAEDMPRKASLIIHRLSPFVLLDGPTDSDANDLRVVTRAAVKTLQEGPALDDLHGLLFNRP